MWVWFSHVFLSFGMGRCTNQFVANYGRFSNTGRIGVATTCQSRFGCKLFLGEFFNEFTNGAANNYDYTPAVNLNSMHSDMIAPRADEFSLGTEQALIADLAAKLYEVYP